jgi:translation initiation factor IF-1
MHRESAIQAEGAIVEVLPNWTYRVQLANGHRLLAFVAGKARLGFARLALGEKVRLELSPYDLSVGRIILNAQTN